MNLVTYSIRTKGAHNFVRRFWTVFTRLGVSERPIQQALHAIMDPPQQYNGAPTFIIPAVALGRCLSLIVEIARDSAEIVISQQPPQQVAAFLHEQGNPHVYCTLENCHVYALYFDISKVCGKTREEQLERSSAHVQEVETLEAPLPRFGPWPDECYAAHSIT
jgi:hypothetical protein